MHILVGKGYVIPDGCTNFVSKTEKPVLPDPRKPVFTETGFFSNPKTGESLLNSDPVSERG